MARTVINKTGRAVRRLWEFTLLGCLLLITACTKSNGYEYVDEDEEQKKATIVVVNENGTTNAFQAGSTIGLFVIAADGTVSYQHVSVDANGAVILPQGATEGKMIIYSPFQSSWDIHALDTPQPFSVQSDQSMQDGYTESDLMVGTWENRTRSDLSLSVRHMLAKMVIHIVDETGGTDLSKISMRLINMNGTVGIDLANTVIASVSEEQRDITMYHYDGTDRRISFSAIVAPQTKPANEEFIEYSLYGSHRFYSVPLTTELQAGMMFTYQMRLTTSGLIPDGTSITNWDNDENSDTYFNIKIHK